MAYSQYFGGLFSQLTAQACVADLTPPTFAGVSAVTTNANGSINVTWLAATDATPPITYLIYIGLGSISAVSLFVSGNLITIAPAGILTKKVFTLGDQTTYLINGQIYTVGVRAQDAVGNINTNTAILTVTGTGYVDLPGSFQATETAFAATEVLLAADHVNFAADHTNFLADHANFVADDALFDADHANFVTDHSNFVTDHTNLNTDHTNIAADHVNLAADHANFVTDHANFVADDANFDADHVNFQSDHTDLQADHANFVADDASFDADHANFVTDHSNFVSDHSAFVTDDANFDADHTAFQAQIVALSSITTNAGALGGAVLIADFIETLMTVETIESV
jgi:hypothetical protein